MKAYSIFDDFDYKAMQILKEASVDLMIHPQGIPRPNEEQMKKILEVYDCVIIGTSQRITCEMFDNIATPRIIATASVGLDHICIPNDKKSLITVINTPKANAQSVAEYTIGMALNCCKRFDEGNLLYRKGKSNKELIKKPEDLYGKTMGVIGAGNISVEIMKYASMFGMKILFWTVHPEKHLDLEGKGYYYAEFEKLISNSDVISVNLPNVENTKGLINRDNVQKMKDNCIFISVSRLETVDLNALMEKANKNANFYVCLDLDLDLSVVNNIKDISNVFVTPHIAGGTIETRKRMFIELANKIAERGTET